MGDVATAGDLAIDVARDSLRKCVRSNDIRAELKAYWDTPRRWIFIRKYYESVNHLLADGYRLSPYEIGLEDYLTPIERCLWNEIRCYGLPFFMQYPVGKRFVDFGDPRRRIAIEADGKAFHSPEKDAIKNADLLAEGWSVFRISGKDAMYHRDPLAQVADIYGLKPISELEAE